MSQKGGWYFSATPMGGKKEEEREKKFLTYIMEYFTEYLWSKYSYDVITFCFSHGHSSAWGTNLHSWIQKNKRLY